MVRLLLLLTAALTLAQCRRPSLVPQEDMIVRTDTQLRITYPRGEHPDITCRASPHQMEDGSVVDGHVIDGSVVDGHVIDGSVVDGWSRLQELDLMVRLEYTDSQSINCSLVPAVSEQNDLDPKALDPSWCLPPIEGGISASLYVCPDGWHLIETRCFLLANASGTWHEGQQSCSEAGGSLATVSSKFQQAILMLTLDEDTWIGFNDLEESSYVWVDGSLSTFTSWAEDKPSESSVLWMIKKQKKCVAMRRKYYYLWSNNHCDDVKQFLCSISAVPITATTSTTTTTTSTTTTTPTTTTTTTTSTTTSTPQSACEEGWQQYQSACYYVSEEEISWQSAQEYCSLLGASLTSVTSEEEHLFLTNLVTENTWIGLSDQRTEGNYVWTDNSTYDFSRWGYNEPSNSYSFLSLDDEDCVEMRWNIDYLWNDEPCDTDNRFICERPVNSNNYGYNTVY